MQYIIVDDEYIAHDIIKGYCNKLPHFKIVGQYYDGIEALEGLKKHQVDVMFLDLNMPKLKGFEMLKSLTNPPQVIVTTAYKEHAVESYELNIVDYLLKPISFDRFLKAVNKLTSKENNSTSYMRPPTTNDSIFIHSHKNHIRIALPELIYIESQGNYCNLVMLDEVLKIREKLSDILQLLPAEKFIQVHKSFAISVDHIKRIEGNRIMAAHHSIPIGKTYKHNVNRLLS